MDSKSLFKLATAALISIGSTRIPAQAQPWQSRDPDSALQTLNGTSIGAVMLHQGALFAANDTKLAVETGPDLPWKSVSVPVLEGGWGCCYLLGHSGEMMMAASNQLLLMASGKAESAVWKKVGDRGYGFAEGAGWMASSRYGYGPGAPVNDLLTVCETGETECRIVGMPFRPRGSFGGMAAVGDTLVVSFDSNYISPDRGKTWTKGAANSILLQQSGYRRLTFQGKSLFRAGAEYQTCYPWCLEASQDLGMTWNAVNPVGLHGFPYDMVSTPQGLAASTDSGVFLSGSDGKNWTRIGSGLPGGAIHDLACEGNVLAGAGWGGVPYVLDLGTVSLRRPGAAVWRKAGAGSIGPGRFPDAGGALRTVDGKRASPSYR